MAELVDAPDSKSGIRKDVQVRFLFEAQKLRAKYGERRAVGYFALIFSSALFLFPALKVIIQLFKRHLAFISCISIRLNENSGKEY